MELYKPLLDSNYLLLPAKRSFFILGKCKCTERDIKNPTVCFSNTSSVEREENCLSNMCIQQQHCAESTEV